MSVRIVIGSLQPNNLKQLAHFFRENGYNVIGETTDGYDFLRKVHAMYPDICIMDFQMKGINGHEISEVLLADNLCPVITMIRPSQQHYFVNLLHEPTFTTLVKPLSRASLLHTAKLMVKTAKHIQGLQEKVGELQKEQDAIRYMESAKELLMKHLHITEDKAHKKILRESMNKGLSKEYIARRIINKYKKK